jgi:hypothetical protein
VYSSIPNTSEYIQIYFINLLKWAIAGSITPSVGKEMEDRGKIADDDVVTEAGVLEEPMGVAPVVVKVETRFSEREMTIRQVAPMVLVLTGATFLVVRIDNIEGNSSPDFRTDHRSSGICHYSTGNKQRLEYTSSSSAMGILFIRAYVRRIPSLVG